MHVTNDLALEKLKSNHELIGCTCDHTANQIIDCSRNDRLRVVFAVTKARDALGHSYAVHGEPWLADFLINLQINGVSESNRRTIRKVIKDEVTPQIAAAVDYFTKNELELSPKDQVIEGKIVDLLAWIDEETEKLIEKGYDPKVIEHAMSEVMARRFGEPLP